MLTNYHKRQVWESGRGRPPPCLELRGLDDGSVNIFDFKLYVRFIILTFLIFSMLYTIIECFRWKVQIKQELFNGLVTPPPQLFIEGIPKISRLCSLSNDDVIVAISFDYSPIKTIIFTSEGRKIG